MHRKTHTHARKLKQINKQANKQINKNTNALQLRYLLLISKIF